MEFLLTALDYRSFVLLGFFNQEKLTLWSAE